jgi:hypothetical protein
MVWEINHPNTIEAGKMASSFKNNIANYHKRISGFGSIGENRWKSDKSIVIEYCFGGTGAIGSCKKLNMKVRGVVSFHSRLGRDASAKLNQFYP